MKYWAVASVMIFGDEVLSLIAVAVLVYMGLFDFVKRYIEENEK